MLLLGICKNEKIYLVNPIAAKPITIENGCFIFFRKKIMLCKQKQKRL